VGISDPAVAERVATKRDAAKHHAFVVNRRATPAHDSSAFSGDGPCPKCKTVIWVDWKHDYLAMRCPLCGHSFDGKEAVIFLSAYEPEDNFKVSLASKSLAAVHLKAATEYWQAREWDKALTECSSAVGIWPTWSAAFNMRALALDGKGVATGDRTCFEAAVAAYTTAIELGFDDPIALACVYYNRGCLYADKLSLPEKALHDFTRAVEVDPGHAGAKARLESSLRTTPPAGSNSPRPVAPTGLEKCAIESLKAYLNPSPPAPPTAAPTSKYGDCPDCGHATNLTRADPDEEIVCAACGCENYPEFFLNQRATPERQEGRGFLGRLVFGSTIEKSDREKREERIRRLRAAISLAILNRNYAEAQFWQTELNRLLDS
jgi:tetratricopeptide (TPR) repeat protein